MSDLLRTLAFAFRRKGADSMPGSDLRLLLAYDLRWFAPEDAKRVVLRATELGLLHEKDGTVRPAFDPAQVNVPLNFRPTTAVLDEEAPASVPPPAPRQAPATPAPPAAAAPSPSIPVPSQPAPPAPALAPPPPPEAPAPAGNALAEAERARRGGLVSLDVAALVVARRAGEDLTERLADAEARLLRKP